jgi:tetratricopeptide (TPR) repeat protein
MLIALAGLLLATSMAAGDELRNVKVGQPVPPFTLATAVGEELSSEALRGKVVVVVYISAEQRSSEEASRRATAVVDALRNPELALVFLTADVAQLPFFRTQRVRLGIRAPLGLDVGREVYGALGLIVLPTTIVIDRDGRLGHVISSFKSDYDHVLDAYARHTLGLVDDAELEKLLTARTLERNRPADRIARHRAAARLLREKGLDRDAENELRSALEIDGGDVDTMLDLASLLTSAQRLDEAEALVARVTEEEPGQRRATLLQGIILYHRGRLDESERLLQAALLLNPDPVLTHYHLGLIKEQQGDQAAAITHFKEALRRLLPKHPM